MLEIYTARMVEMVASSFGPTQPALFWTIPGRSSGVKDRPGVDAGVGDLDAGLS